MEAYSLELPMNIYQELEAVAKAEQMNPATLIQHLLVSDRLRKKQDGSENQRKSVVDIFRAAPGHRLFETASDVDHFLAGERALWDN